MLNTDLLYMEILDNLNLCWYDDNSDKILFRTVLLKEVMKSSTMTISYI
jgi:hypothetical protein